VVRHVVQLDTPDGTRAAVAYQPHNGPQPGQVAVTHPAQIEVKLVVSLGDVMQRGHQGGVRRLIDLPGNRQAGRAGGFGDPQHPIVISGMTVVVGGMTVVHRGSTSLAAV
jgi:hypothetical protein